MRCRRRWTLDKLAYISSFLYSVDSDRKLVSASACPGNTSVYANWQSTRRRSTWHANDCMTPLHAGVCGATQPVCLLCANYCVRRLLTLATHDLVDQFATSNSVSLVFREPEDNSSTQRNAHQGLLEARRANGKSESSQISLQLLCLTHCD